MARHGTALRYAVHSRAAPWPIITKVSNLSSFPSEMYIFCFLKYTQLMIMAVNWKIHRWWFGLKKLKFPRKIDISGQHWCNARNLFFLVHVRISRSIGLEIKGYFPGHTSHIWEQIFGRTLALQNMADGLDKPWSGSGISPWVKAWYSTVSNQKIRMRWNLVAHGVRVRCSMTYIAKLDTAI